MRARLFPWLLLAAVAGTACSTIPEGQRSTRPAPGPPEVEQATVERHARQFDDEEPVRLAGSQEELAASAYILAHLHEAGYVARLDGVPVKDVVRSTNVVALPPNGEKAEVLVVVAYDSHSGAPPGGLAIGVWLEVARALRAEQPDHSVEFVALGAEHATVGGGRLGSRRLARQLADEGATPHVLVVDQVGGDLFAVAGHARRALHAQARELGFSGDRSTAPADAGAAFDAADLDTTVVSGPAEVVGPVLLAYLSSL